jgi:phospholipase D1/2
MFDHSHRTGSFIGKMERKSGIRFHEAQVALACAWVSGDEQTDQKEVTVTIPQETTEGLMVTPKTPPKTETVPMPTTYDAALKVVERWHRGAEGLRGDEEVSDTVSQHMLHEKGLVDEKWLGTSEEELNAYVFCLLFCFVID